MKVLLIQPNQGTSFGISKIVTTEPLGLESIASPLIEHGHDVRILDLKVEKRRRLEEELRRFRPRAVGISCSFTTDVYSTVDIARFVKGFDRKAFVFVGGHHASLLPDDVLTDDVDAVCVGEGEATAAELADRLEAGGDPAEVAGVLTRRSRREGLFRPRPLAKSIDDFPLPARHLTRHLRDHYHVGFDVPSATMETSRGCPFDCNFCSVWVFFNRKARVKDPERALEEIVAIEEDHIFFTDDIAFINRKESEKLALMLKHEGVKKQYTAETRADLIVRHKDLIALWREVGLKTLFIGIEKVDDEGLKSVNKRTTSSINEQALDYVRSIGIHPIATFIVDPAFDEEDFDKLERYVAAHELAGPTFTILTPLPGTEVYEERKDELTTRNYYFYDLLHAVLPTRLPLERFYERYAALFNYGHVSSKLNLRFLSKILAKLSRHNVGVALKVFNLMRMMRNPSKYMELHHRYAVYGRTRQDDRVHSEATAV